MKKRLGVVAAAILLAGCAGANEAAPAADGPSEPEVDAPDGGSLADELDDIDWAEHYGHTEVDPETFVERWNGAIAEYGWGYSLEPLVWEHKQYNMDAAKQYADGWIEVEATRHPDGPLSTFAITAVVDTEDQGADLIAMIVASVHALTDLDPEAAFEFAERELGLTEDQIDPDGHFVFVSVDGVSLELTGGVGHWSLWAAADGA
jgi:hypothetical protein